MAQASHTSAAAGLKASDAGPNEVARKIAETEQELREVKQEIKDLNSRLDADEFVPDRRYPTRDDARTGLNLLQNEKVALRNEKAALQNEKVLCRMRKLSS
jgi:hypothetical protein